MLKTHVWRTVNFTRVLSTDSFRVFHRPLWLGASSAATYRWRKRIGVDISQVVLFRLNQLLNDATHGNPSRPTTARRGLPLVEQCIVGPASEYFQPAVSILPYCRVTSNDTSHRRPTRPSAARRCLPLVEQCVVSALSKYLQAAIGITLH